MSETRSDPKMDHYRKWAERLLAAGDITTEQRKQVMIALLYAKTGEELQGMLTRIAEAAVYGNNDEGDE